jgi:hypothetical protein
MAYSKFTLADVLRQFPLTLQDKAELFPNVTPVVPSPALQLVLDQQVPLALKINTEKARSEMIITPLLLEIWRQTEGRVSLFSGVNFDVDESVGLSGFCDYLLTKSSQQYFVEAPVFAVVEAKNENISGGLGQCVAEMIAAQRFNKQEKEKINIETIWGAVTTGTNWRFLRLDGTTLQIDKDEESLQLTERLLGILIAIAT